MISAWQTSSSVGDETTGGVGDSGENPAAQQSAEEQRDHDAGSAPCGLGMGRKLGKPVAHEGRKIRPQNEPAIRFGQFRQSGNQIMIAVLADHGLVTGELAIKREAAACEPDERVPPQQALANLLDQADEIVASPGVDELVQKNRFDLVPIQ
jgi:hypothetical protein